MAGHSRSKNGVASLAYVPAIHVFLLRMADQAWMPGTTPGMTARLSNRRALDATSESKALVKYYSAAVSCRKGRGSGKKMPSSDAAETVSTLSE